jgi:predicted transposase/invertase (TIGR01784 family)
MSDDNDKLFKVHDKLVHGVFSSAENAAALIRSALPADLTGRIDFSTLEPRPTKYTGPHLEEGHSDLLYAVELDGEPVLLYVLVEHWSSSRRFAVVRLLLYLALTYQGICRDDRPEVLPVIVPVILHHSEQGWTAPTRFEDVIDPSALAHEELLRYVPRFEFLLDDISRASDEELRLRRLPLLGTLALWLLRDGRNPDRFFAALVVWAGALEEVASEPDGEGIAMLMSYIIEVLGKELVEKLRQRLAELALNTEQIMQSIADSFREEGRREGLEKGLEEGQRAIVRRQLVSKFGPLPESVERRLEAATPVELERYADDILDAERMSDIFENVE